MKRNLIYGLLVCLFVCASGMENNAFAAWRNINSLSDWANVGADDYVTIKMSGTVTLPSDITCKQISFEQNNTILDLNGHTLNVTENLYMTNREGLQIINGNINVTKNFEMKSKNGIVTGNVSVGEYLYMIDQENMSITGNVTVGKDFQMKSKSGFVTGNVTVGGKFYMVDQENMHVTGNVVAGEKFEMKSKNGYVDGDVTVTNGDLELTNQENMSITGSVHVSGNFTLESKGAQIGSEGESIEVGGSLVVRNQENMGLEGDVSVEGDVTMESKNGKITGNVSVGGSLYLRNQENMSIDGNVSVGGNLEMTGRNNNITGTAAIAGTSNISNGSTITGGTTAYVPPVRGSVSITDNQCTSNSFTAVPSEFSPTSYQWYNDDESPVSGATSATFEPSSVGSYYVIATEGSNSVRSDNVEYYGGVSLLTDVSVSSLSFVNKLDGGSTSQKTITVTTICEPTITYSLSGVYPEKFTVTNNNDNTYTVTFNENSEEGTYNAVLSLSDGNTIKEVDLTGVVANYPMCYNVTVDVDGSYYKTAQLCTDNEGNINIDLSNVNGFWYIPTSECPSSNTMSVKRAENDWITVCKDVKIHFDNDIVCNNFSFVNNINYDAPHFVFEKKVTCENMELTVNQSQSIDYIEFDCSSVIYANTSFKYVHCMRPISIKGSIISPDVYLSDGNSTSIQIDECAYIHTDLLTLVQSAQNNVIINGHVIAETIKSDANIVLSYNGDITKPAVVTVGSVASNILLVCGKYTTVNLCLNPSGSADKIGYFVGDVLYNYSAGNGWSSNTPAEEGDINYSSFFGFDDDWRYSNWRSTWGISADDLRDVNQIRAYSSYDNCMNELTDAMLLGMDDDPFIPKDKEIKILYDDFNPCSEEYESSKVQIREMGGKWFRVINGELIYCENDN